MARRRALWAALGTIAILWIAAWLDTSYFPRVARRAAADFDASSLSLASAFGFIGVGGACLLVGWLAWRSRALVGLLYAALGMFLVFLPWLVATFAASRGDAGPLLPVRLSRALADLWLRTDGPLNAVSIIAGAMLLVGVASLVRSFRTRRAPATAPTTEGAAPV